MTTYIIAKCVLGGVLIVIGTLLWLLTSETE